MTNQRREEGVLLEEAAVEAQLQLQLRQYIDRINNNFALAEMAYTSFLQIYFWTKDDYVGQVAYARSFELILSVRKTQYSFATLGTTKAYRDMSLANRVLILKTYLDVITKNSNELSHVLGDLNHHLSTLKEPVL